MNEKHTPGPWLVARQITPWVDGAPTTQHLCVIAPIQQRAICSVTPWPQKDDQDEPNARLIAAAPELLEACKLMLIRLESMPELPKGGVYDIARAAIAKAEGKS